MTAFVLAFQAAIWLAIGYLFIRSRSASIFHPFSFYLAFHGVVFVIRPIMEQLFGFEHTFFQMRFYPTEEQEQLALILTTVALFVFAATSCGIGLISPRFDRSIPPKFSGVEWRAFCVVTAITAPIILYSLYLTIRNSVASESGNDTVGMDRDVNTGIAVFTDTTGYIVDAQKMLGTLCVMLIWGARFRLWSFAPLMAYLADRVYEGWSRWTIVTSLATLVMLYVVQRRRRWLPVTALALAVPLLVLFQQLGENRDAFKGLFTGQQAQVDVLDEGRTWIEKQDTLDFANFDFLTYVMDVVPEKSGTYTYFTQYLQLFTEPIPRILWPNKPFGPPIQLVNMNDYGNFVGFTVSLVGDGWMSGGWLGVIATMALVGLILSKLHRWYWHGDATHFKILVYCTFLPLSLQWFRDGGISIAKFVLFTISPILIWWLSIRYLQGIPAPRMVRALRRGRQASPPMEPTAFPPAE